MVGDHHADAREDGAQAVADGWGAFEEVFASVVIEEDVVGTSLYADLGAGGFDQRAGLRSRRGARCGRGLRFRCDRRIIMAMASHSDSGGRSGRYCGLSAWTRSGAPRRARIGMASLQIALGDVFEFV